MKRARVVLTLLVVGGLLSLLAVGGLLGLGGAPQASTGSGHEVVCPHDGDVNQDGAVTPSDALLAFRAFLGLADLDACQQDRANVRTPEHPTITPADAWCLFQVFLGLRSCLDTPPPRRRPGPTRP